MKAVSRVPFSSRLAVPATLRIAFATRLFAALAVPATLRIASATCLAAIFAAFMAFTAGAAQLDTVADAVLGKVDLSTNESPGSAAAVLYVPPGVAEDPVSGALWVADQGHNRVLRFSTAAAFANGESANLVLGQPNFSSVAPNRGGAVAANTMYWPRAVAVDQAGRVYVADSTNNRILVFRPPFTNGMAATWVIGQADFLSGAANRGGSVAGNTLRLPLGLALDRAGNLYVADQANNRVLKFQAPAVTGAFPIGVFGQAGFNTATQVNGATGLSLPFHLTIDGNGHLWVADNGNSRVLRYGNAAFPVGEAANLVLCQPNFTAESPDLSSVGCNGPTGVAVDAEGAVYVSDRQNNRILRFTTLANGAAATGLIGQPWYSTGLCNQGWSVPGATTLCWPEFLALDRAGNLIVPDAENDRVLRYDLPRARAMPSVTALSPWRYPQGGPAFTLTVTGHGFYHGSVVNWNGSPRPTVFLSDERLLAQVAAADVAGAGPHWVTVTTPAPGGGLSALVGLVTYLRTPLDATADRVLAQPDFTSNLGDNPVVGEERLGRANAATLGASALGMAIDRASGRLFVAETEYNRVLSWPDALAFRNAQPADVVIGQPDEFRLDCNADGRSASSLCVPRGLAVDPAGALYVADTGNHRVLKFVPPFSTGMSATRVFGQGGSFTTGVANKGGLNAGSLNTPYGVAVHGSALFVNDSANARILVYQDPDTDLAADVAIGQSTLTSAAVDPPGPTRFGAGGGMLALDGGGRLHYSVIAQNRVLRFSPPFSTGMAADLVLGQANFGAIGAATTAAGLKSPVGVAVDPGGSVLVADYGNHRIVRYAAPLSSGMAATGVLGQADFVTGAGGTSATKLFNPSGVAVHTAGDVFALDNGNRRVLAFDRPFPVPLDPAADLDGDGIPNGVEITEGRDPYVKDNDIFTGNRLFVMQQYRDFLWREGDPGGIQYHTGLLASGLAVRANVIENFFNSPEFSGAVAPIVRLYFATFLRVPDYAGLQYQVSAYRTGTALTVIANNFSLSPEFQARYGTLTDAQYVALLYQNLLARTPAQAEVDYHVARLASGVTRGEVMVGFSESPEYSGGMYVNVYVTMMYVGMLRRAPEPEGFRYWLLYMDAGNPGISLILGFLAAPEYHDRFLP